MKSIQSGVSTVVSVVLISISASEALASQKKPRPGSSASVQSGGQTHTQRRRAVVAGKTSTAKPLQEKMQNENRGLTEPANTEIPNLRGTRGIKRKRAASGVVERDLNQPDMAAKKNEVSVETREKSSTSTRRRSSFNLPEVDDQVLLRKRGQPHKQPPSRRHPHKMT